MGNRLWNERDRPRHREIKWANVSERQANHQYVLLNDHYGHSRLRGLYTLKL